MTPPYLAVLNSVLRRQSGRLRHLLKCEYTMEVTRYPLRDLHLNLAILRVLTTPLQLFCHLEPPLFRFCLLVRKVMLVT